MARLAVAAMAAVLSASLSACTQGRDRASSEVPAPGVVVASFNFPESALVASIYAEALEGAGIPVRRELDLGPRELVQPALQQGLVDVVPEYLGAALTGFSDDGGQTANDVGAAHTALQAALSPWDLTALDPAPAQNQNGLAVTRATADRLGIRSVSDLASVDEPLVLAGPPECPKRPHCVPGYRTAYGLTFDRFVPLGTAAQRATALRQGVVDVAVVFTTDSYLASSELVLLDDDRRMQPVENVVPIVSTRALAAYGDRLSAPLQRVSAALSTRNLTVLNWRLDAGTGTLDREARGWLVRRGLVERDG